MCCILMIVMATVNSRLATQILWKKEKNNDWWEHIVDSTFNQQDWLNNFVCRSGSLLSCTYGMNFSKQLKSMTQL